MILSAVLRLSDERKGLNVLICNHFSPLFTVYKHGPSHSWLFLEHICGVVLDIINTSEDNECFATGKLCYLFPMIFLQLETQSSRLWGNDVLNSGCLYKVP